MPAGAFSMNARLLVVDDEAPLAAAAAQKLMEEGFQVEKLLAGADDVVVTDVSMPILTGPEMLARAQAQSGKLQRCVIIGGYAPDADAATGLEHARWMVRPVSLPDLVAAVKDQLS
jgi:DNA-binding response OmpR family regulator